VQVEGHPQHVALWIRGRWGGAKVAAPETKLGFRHDHTYRRHPQPDRDPRMGDPW
jgi:hypothetical protein